MIPEFWDYQRPKIHGGLKQRKTKIEMKTKIGT